MSDAFSDLWNSTGASKPVEPPRKLGTIASASSAQPAARKPQSDVFSMLAAASSSSTVASRSVTPAQSSALGSNVAAKTMQKAASTGTTLGKGDAFSDLLSGFSGAQSSNNTNLTMAQRAALAEQERKQRAQQQASQPAAHAPSSAWAGLDALGTSSTTAASHTSSASHDPLDDLGFGAFSSATTTSSAPPKPAQAAHANDDWGLEDFTSHLAPAPAPSGKSAQSSNFDDLLGFDDFAGPSVSRQSSSPAPPRSNTPGDFDFGNREDRLLDNQSSDEDDILGDLSKPVEKLAARQPSARNTPSPQPPRSGQRSRAVSPPPHVIGQIVEMGFSIQQARVALAATDTGLDVQAALDMLLSNGAASSSPAPEQQQESRRRPSRKPGHERYYGSDEEEGGPPQRQQQRPPTRSPPQAQRSTRDRPARDSPLGPEAQKNLQEQADKLLAQASEIGLNMFNKANAFWKEGKERVQRAYEERAATAGSSRPTAGPGTGRGGRPKWMQDAADDEHRPDTTHTGGFRDDDDDGPSPPRPPQAKQPPQRAPEQPVAESPASRLKVGNLFSDDPPAVYVSPFRRKGNPRTQTTENSPAATPALPAQRATPSPVPARAPSPIPLVQRRTVSASPSAIAESAKQKTAGTEKYKLGQYAEAESLYSAAIRALPESHLLLVPLYNNRALTRIKTGDHTGAIEDCTTVINLIGASYHPSREAKVTRTEDGAGVDLADGLVKAWWRRAEAYEGKEKWDAARQDWEAIAGADFAGKVRTEAVRGIGRCRRMLNTDASTGVSTAPPPPAAAAAAAKPKPNPAPPRARPRVPTPPSEALNRVREANEAAEAEDQQRHELKDAVEARLGAWKAGKETNIRALIASLDTVLWPELGWQKVGIHELVSPSQVKIRYTKAIAKVHPDKLNVRNTTVEQRMIANGVFGALNEAWNAFKP